MSTRPGKSRRRAGFPFIIAGAVLAVLTAGAVIYYTTSATGTASGTVPVVVASHDLGIRVPIVAADLVVANFHTEDVPPGSFSTVSELKDLVAAINIGKGQAVTSNLVVKSTDSVLGPQSAYLPIPAGFVALTIPTSEQQGVAGFIQVGDYLSLVVQLAGKTNKNVRTVYTNIPVIRVGTAPAETAPGVATNPPKTGGISSSLTVVVTQCQAEFITWFLVNGTLTYTLESYHDYSAQAVALDPTCPNATAAKGVTQTDVAARWPGILS